jgi:D-3-phosphoglycerate dehydrogenase / 2-oxoglutarate reductase
MKTCLAIGDLFVPPEAMREGLSGLEARGFRVETALYDAGDYDALQAACLRTEKSGPDSVTLPDSLHSRMAAADMIVVHFCPVGRSVIGSNRSLRMIGTCRTGLANIDAAAAREADVAVVNCPGRLADAVADFTVGLMISEARNIARGHEALKRGEWRRRYHNLGRIPDLPGHTVGLVGLGAIGRGVARRLQGFDMRVVAADPFADPAVAASLHVELLPLDDLLRASDFVSIHVDVRPETRNLIDRRRIGLMKQGAYFINTARAEVVDEEALIEALRGDKIAGAALDVYRAEPLPEGHPLLALDNVTLTPHMSGGSDDAFRRSPRLLCRIIEEELRKRETRA